MNTQLDVGIMCV